MNTFKLKFCTKSLPFQISNLGSEPWFVQKCSNWTLLRVLFLQFLFIPRLTKASSFAGSPNSDSYKKGFWQKIRNTKMAYGTKTCILLWFSPFLFIPRYSSPFLFPLQVAEQNHSNTKMACGEISAFVLDQSACCGCHLSVQHHFCSPPVPVCHLTSGKKVCHLTVKKYSFFFAKLQQKKCSGSWPSWVVETHV